MSKITGRTARCKTKRCGGTERMGNGTWQKEIPKQKLTRGRPKKQNFKGYGIIDIYGVLTMKKKEHGKIRIKKTWRQESAF
jgi:hypothetical protein